MPADKNTGIRALAQVWTSLGLLAERINTLEKAITDLERDQPKGPFWQVNDQDRISIPSMSTKRMIRCVKCVIRGTNSSGSKEYPMNADRAVSLAAMAEILHQREGILIEDLAEEVLKESAK